jgi:hypothetical protein
MNKATQNMLGKRIKAYRKEGLTYKQIIAKLNSAKIKTATGKRWKLSNFSNWIATHVNR